MKKNVGTADKMVRLLLGAAIAGWGIYAQNLLGLIAIIPLGTALVSFCPLYLPLGLRTCPKED